MAGRGSGRCRAEAWPQRHQLRLQRALGAQGHQGHLPSSLQQKPLSKSFPSSSECCCLKSSHTRVSHTSSLIVVTRPPLPLKQLFINHRHLAASNKAHRSGKHSVNSERGRACGASSSAEAMHSRAEVNLSKVTRPVPDKGT